MTETRTGPENCDVFDFDRYRALADSNPAEFERQRKIATSQVIDRLDASPRLRGLQFTIDMERMRCRTAHKSSLRLYQMMWERFLVLNDVLLRSHSDPESLIQDAPPSARILPFKHT